MIASETRKLAREALSGKWKKAVLITLVYTLITGGLNCILNFIPFVGSIAKLVIKVPLAFGLVITLIKLYKGEETTYIEFFSNGFNNFVSSWKVSIWSALKLIIPILLVIASILVIALGLGPSAFSSMHYHSFSNNVTITYMANPIVVIFGFIALVISSIWLAIESFLYKPVFYVLYDNPDMHAKDVVEKSAELMYGHRWAWFCLDFSFIGWALLSVFTFGIGYLWLLPYVMFAEFVFYDFLKETAKKQEESKEDE